MIKVIDTKDIEVQIEDMKIRIKGKRGELERDFSDPRYNKFIKIEKSNNEIKIITTNDRRFYKAIVGTIAAHIKNMIIGVTKGFVYKVKVNFAHFPVTLEQKDSEIIIKNFMGEKGIRKSKLVGNVKIKIEKDIVTIEGNNIEEVAQTAANLEFATKLKRKDRRVFGDGCFIMYRGVLNE